MLKDRMSERAKLELFAVLYRNGVNVEGYRPDVRTFETSQGITVTESGARYSNCMRDIENMRGGELFDFLYEEAGGQFDHKGGNRLLLIDQLLRECGVTDE